jgi:NADH-quinone oxidoreductase subunit M
VFGDVTNDKLDDIQDMTRREIIIIAPLAFFTLLLGVYPSLVTDITGPSVEALLANFQQAVGG